MFHSLDLLQLFDNCNLCSAKHAVAEVVDKITIRHMYEWQMSIDREVGTNRNILNKLRFNDCLNASLQQKSTVK